MSGKFLFIAMLLFAAGIVAASIYTIGGPTYARQEKHDFDLLTDMTVLSSRLKCRTADVVLPQKLVEAELLNYCGGGGHILRPERRRVKDTEITYNRINDSEFELCATFFDTQRADLIRNGGSVFDTKTGCLSGTIR
ncbi:MAG: hypothetical protein AAGA08_11915 [Pseudomonadota bacterium]